MSDLPSLLWIESRKAARSRMPLWTALGSLFMPLGIAFLIFVAKNPQISQKLGLVGAKANLVAYAGMDWPAYMGLFGQLISMGGFVLFVLIISWVFGREFADGTLKDILAVPVPRLSILLAKFILTAAWCGALAGLMFVAGLGMGAAMHLPGGIPGAIFQDSLRILVSAGLAILVVLPFALLASVGRGYLLPIGAAILTMMMTNIAAILGWGEFFPWAVPGLYSQAKSALPPASYWIVFLTGLIGIFVTYLWWKYADQNR
jgi:ABC-2 type transport system permease protein